MLKMIQQIPPQTMKLLRKSMSYSMVRASRVSPTRTPSFVVGDGAVPLGVVVKRRRSSGTREFFFN